MEDYEYLYMEEGSEPDFMYFKKNLRDNEYFFILESKFSEYDVDDENEVSKSKCEKYEYNLDVLFEIFKKEAPEIYEKYFSTKKKQKKNKVVRKN